MREFLFFLKAAFIAPFHFRPKKCHVKNPEKCRIWNCKYHYKNKKYDDCQRYCKQSELQEARERELELYKRYNPNNVKSE